MVTLHSVERITLLNERHSTKKDKKISTGFSTRTKNRKRNCEDTASDLCHRRLALVHSAVVRRAVKKTRRASKSAAGDADKDDDFALKPGRGHATV